MALESRHESSVLKLTIAHRALCFGVLQVVSRLSLAFDSSAGIVLLSASPLARAWLDPLVRWDTIHFLGAASPGVLPPVELDRAAGYAFEHTLAFQPGLPLLLRAAGSLRQTQWSLDQSLIVGTGLALMSSCLAPWLLFRATRTLCNDANFAFKAAILSILSPAPATLLAPTPEVFFSAFSLLGFWVLAACDARASLMRSVPAIFASALAFAAATSFRANGALLAGFVLWYGIWSTSLGNLTLFKRAVIGACAVLAAGLVLAPVVVSQLWAYERFCRADQELVRPWCSSSVPAAYSFVQSKYWDVGLLRYWTLAQLPNFILAGPILILLGLTLRYTSGSADAMLRSILKPGSSPQPLPRSGVAISFANTPHLVPHLLFTWITALLLVFASHVQIALRFASPGGLPAVWWAAASVVRRTEQVEPHKRLKITRLGSVLCAYLVIWNITSLVLYGGFYPPA